MFFENGKINNKFADLLGKLDNKSFCGLAVVLGVDLWEDEKTHAPRDAASIILDMIESFSSLSRSTRRTVIKEMEVSLNGNLRK